MSTKAVTASTEDEDCEFIRHPADIPLEYFFSDPPVSLPEDINAVCSGGVSFHAEHYIEPLQWLRLHIPIHEEHFEIEAQVRSCQVNEDGGFTVGVLFANSANAFSARMMEQVCHIEHYKREVLRDQGRQLSVDEAAAEWIEKYANTFPHWPSGHNL